jgi:glycine betaine/proline transport system substrate-binding protein
MTSVVGEAAITVVDFIEVYFGGLLSLLSRFLDGLINMVGGILSYPGPLVFIILLIFISILITKRLVLPLLIGLAFAVINYMGYWESSIDTLTMVLVSTLVAVAIAIPLGIWASNSESSNTVIKAVMDFMQTMPAFVYLIPAIIFFGLGAVPGVIATVIFAMPPVVRLTNLGIRQVPKEMNEVADAFGSTKWDKLTKVQLPIAMPSIMTGINQCIMLSLSMVVIAAMIGGGGLGGDIVYALNRIDIAVGFEAGLAVVLIAMTLDRLTQSFTKTEPEVFVSRSKKDTMRTLKIGTGVLAVFLVVSAGAFFFVDEDKMEDIEFAGDVLDNGAKLGLAVTTYTYDMLGVRTVSDLDTHFDAFKGKIIGIDSGAGIMNMTEQAIEDYGLNFELQSSSEAGMLTSLKAAYENNEYIVVTLWDPHWAASKYEMIYLDDDLGVYGEAESIQSWARNGLLKNDADLALLMSRYSYSVDEFNGLLEFIEDRKDGSDISESALMWLTENEDIKEKWLKDLNVGESRGNIVLGLVDWSCAVGSTNVLKHLLEELGYTVETRQVTAGPLYAGLAYGHIDLTTTVWAPATHGQYLDEYGPKDWNGPSD